jgi:hypothetical protein
MRISYHLIKNKKPTTKTKKKEKTFCCLKNDLATIAINEEKYCSLVEIKIKSFGKIKRKNVPNSVNCFASFAELSVVYDDVNELFKFLLNTEALGFSPLWINLSGRLYSFLVFWRGLIAIFHPFGLP